MYRRLGEPQGRSGQVRKISPPPGFDPLTVQPVASRYTYYAIPAPHIYIYIYLCVCVLSFCFAEGTKTLMIFITLAK